MGQINILSTDGTHKAGLSFTGTSDISVDAGNIASKTQLDSKPTGFKNYIINGGFDVWQRGTSFSNHTSYSSDRWKTYSGNTGSIIKLNNVQLPNNHKVNAFRWEATGTATTYVDTYQLIEDFQKLSYKTFTMSAWVRTNMNNVFFRQGSTTNFGEEMLSDGIWHFVSRTFTLGAIVDSTIDLNGSGFGIVKMSSQYSVGHYLEFTNVQLEEGSVATPFEQRSYGLELSLCQRYYQKKVDVSSSCLGGGYGSRVWCAFKTNTRIVPTITIGNPINSYAGARNTSINADIQYSAVVTPSVEGFTFMFYGANHDSNNQHQMVFSYTASAEL